MSEAVCSKCDMCGKEVPAELSCTLMLEDNEKIDKACWCVCKDCSKQFKEDIVDFYKPLVKEIRERDKNK